MAKIGQYAILQNKKTVLVLQRARSGGWSLPGGRLDKKEDPEKALVREIKEETGLICLDLTPVDVNLIEDPYQIKYCVYFTGEVRDAPDLKISEEHKDFKWVGREEAEAMSFEDEKIKESIKRVLVKN